MGCASPKFTLGRGPNWSRFFDATVCLAQERRKRGCGDGCISKLEEAMEKQLKAVGVEFERELMLVPNRRFRFDFTFRSAGLVAEIEGGTWSGGRHTTGAGFRKDCEKYNLASLEGWTVMRFTSDMVKKGLALEQIVAYLDQEEAQASSDGL